MPRRIVRHVHSDEADGHHDHVAIAGRLQRRDEMCEKVRPSDGDQQVAGVRLNVIQTKVGGGQELKVVEGSRVCRVRRPLGTLGRDQQPGKDDEEQGARDGCRIAGDQHQSRGDAERPRDEHQSPRPLACRGLAVQRHPERAQLGPTRAEADQGGDLQESRADEPHGVHPGQPPHLTRTHHDDGDLRDDDHVHETRGGPISRVQRTQRAPNQALLRQARKHGLGANHRARNRAGQKQRGSQDDAQRHHEPEPPGSWHVGNEGGKGSIEPRRTAPRRRQRCHEKTRPCGHEHRIETDQLRGTTQVENPRRLKLGRDVSERLHAADREEAIAQRRGKGERRSHQSGKLGPTTEQTDGQAGHGKRGRSHPAMQRGGKPPEDKDRKQSDNACHDPRQVVAREGPTVAQPPPDEAEQTDGHNRRNIGGRDLAANLRHTEERAPNRRHVVTCGAGRQGPKQQLFDEERRRRHFGGLIAECLPDGPIQPTRQEERAALEIDCSQRPAQQHGRKHEPRCRRAEGLFRDTAGKERGSAELEEYQRGTTPGRNK